ncbi:DNA-binding response regulator, OmpR family, contains REC and winged-helix (wHTH) domain [Marinobacter daqiaonensis]|uniref:DNA-binding response regulator, OmpR family, contains REC and winged-helix (WHTH) domain n=1 Tax=Marinobacter daqiaonensis TaxID=650891 RepID=A0A1I6HLR1_9GAMM|nr:response regulator transcription factor [Marinobacter daqiaonensis]SFR55277.1 DNA-binding response regulator, OmpR family, contains REC and winged-helix (wHTH) domain [Marinobacter daqiaonensis]
MQNRVLLVEDDDELRMLLARYLGGQGFEVREAATGGDGLALAAEGLTDIVVLDIMLPDVSGLEVLRKLRGRNHLPVILLTARGDETDRIVGFEVGADDYIPKPCNPRELVARIHAVLRRVAWDHQAEASPDGVFGDLRVEQDQRRVFLREQPLDLTATEYEVLQVLLAHAGSAVRKTDLMQWALGRRLAAHDRTLDMHISNLRRKLGPEDPSRIETIRGLGYSYRITGVR